MQSESTAYWKQKVAFDDLWNTVILDATMVIARDGRSNAWYGSLYSERFRGPLQVFPQLLAGEVVAVDATFPDGLSVKGDLTLRTWGTQWILWTSALTWHYPAQEPQVVEGSLLAFGLTPPPPPPPPPPAPPAPPAPSDADDPSPTPFVRPSAGPEGAVFPYQFLKPWPSPSADELALNFVSYPPRARALPDAFVRCEAALKQSPTASTRVDMAQAARDYLDDQAFKGQSFAAAPFVTRLANLPAPFSRYSEARATVATLARTKPPSDVIAALRALVGAPDLDDTSYLTTLTSVWQSLFATVIELGFDPSLRRAFFDVVVVDHLLVWLSTPAAATASREDLEALAHATVVLPATIFPLPPAGAAPTKAPSGDTWIAAYAVGELELVKQRLVRYTLGEIAAVRSVMAGERRKEVRRSASRVLSESSRTSAEGRRTRNDAHSRSLTGEAQAALEDAITTATFNNFSASYGPPASPPSPPQTVMNGSWTLERSPSPTAPGEASNYGREVLERAAQRVTSRVVEARANVSLRESEESLTSELDNTHGQTGRRGIYRWLNEVYEARVIHYGSRLLVELVIASPATAYLREQSRQGETSAPPVSPASLGVTSYANIDATNLPMLASRYPSRELTLPPPDARKVSGWARSGEPLSITLPDGYRSTAMSVGYVVADQTSLTLSGIVGSTAFNVATSTATGVYNAPLPDETGTVQVIVLATTKSTAPAPPPPPPPPPAPHAAPPVVMQPVVTPEALAPVQVSVEITATPDASCTAAWQLQTYQTIQGVYAEQLAAWRGAALGAAVPARPRTNANGLARRAIKRGAFELLFEVQRAREGEPIDAIEVSTPRSMQFFERAFEWNEMSYGFLEAGKGPSAPPSPAQDDEALQAFLAAAYAQALLPVRPGEALHVVYFLASGQLWNGADDAIPVHEGDRALALALKQIQRAPKEPRPVGEPWEVIVPTTTTVLQDGAGSLRELAIVHPGAISEGG